MIQDLTPFLSVIERSKSLSTRSIGSEECEGDEEFSKPDSCIISGVIHALSLVCLPHDFDIRYPYWGIFPSPLRDLFGQ